MYEELAKRIRGCSYSDPNGCEECRACPNADNYYECKQKLALQAADAIEELSAVAESYKRSVEAWAETAGKAVEQIPRWIPVTERCPEKSGDYLVFDDCRNLYVNEWHCLLKKWQYDDSRITHWMPLPEPPKEEE